MRKSAKNRAEQVFSASQKKSDAFLKQKEKAWQESKDNAARLKALRLAKEAAEQEGVDLKNPESEGKKPKASA